MKFKNRVTEILGVEIPIVQAPMGWIARSQLASAVSNAGALGIIETSSGELDIVKDEIRKMADLTDKPFGVNIAQAFVRDPNIVDFVIDQGIRFVTTSAGSPMMRAHWSPSAWPAPAPAIPRRQRARSRRPWCARKPPRRPHSRASSSLPPRTSAKCSSR